MYLKKNENACYVVCVNTPDGRDSIAEDVRVAGCAITRESAMDIVAREEGYLIEKYDQEPYVTHDNRHEYQSVFQTEDGQITVHFFRSALIY